MAPELIALALALIGAGTGCFAVWRVLTLPTNAGVKRSFSDLVDHVDSMATKLNSIARSMQTLESDTEHQLEQATGRLRSAKQREANERRRNGGVEPQAELTLDEQAAAMEAQLFRELVR